MVMITDSPIRCELRMLQNTNIEGGSSLPDIWSWTQKDWPYLLENRKISIVLIAWIAVENVVIR